MATFTTYDSIGMAEDVSDIITNIDPMDRPFCSSIGSTKVSARNPEWQEDTYTAAVDLQDAHIEGADFTLEDRTPTTMRSNYTEIRALAFAVSETSDAVKTYGRAKETAYQLAKAGREVQRAWEYKLMDTGTPASNDVPGIDAALGDATTNARVAANVWGSDPSSVQCLTNRNVNTTTPITFDEDEFLSGMQQTYTEGAPGKTIMVSPEITGWIQGWTTLTAGRYRDNALSQQMVMVVDLLVTPFGQVSVVPNRHMQAATALLYDPQYWKMGVLRPWTRINLAKTGDLDKFAIRAELTTKHMNYAEGYGWATLTAPA